VAAGLLPSRVWLADELERKFQKWLPQGISQPRIHLEQDRLVIACKVRRGALAGVASTEVGVWVTEDHRLALSIDALRAGLIPLPASDMFEPVVRRLQRDGQRIEWGNSQGKDVLVLDLFSESGDRQAEDQPVRQLDSVEVLPGKLRVRGRQVDQPAVR
jgi:hypothetical protein